MTRREVPAAVRWTAYVAIAVVFAIACGFLADWQFTRNAERSRQLELIAANFDAAPVALDDVIAPGGALSPDDEWRPVQLHGQYLPDAQVLARNRAHGGTAAFEVLVPFRLDGGRVLLVNRGWVPPASDRPDPAEVPAPPEGDVTVIVRLRPGEPLPSSGRSAPEGQVPTIHLPLVTGLLSSADSASLEQSAYGLMVSEDPAPAARPSPLEDPSEDPGPHLSYAIQWILFAVMGFVFIWYVIRSERRHRREDAAEAVVAHGRRDRDAEDEDALLDNAEIRRG